MKAMRSYFKKHPDMFQAGRVALCQALVYLADVGTGPLSGGRGPPEAPPVGGFQALSSSCSREQFPTAWAL